MDDRLAPGDELGDDGRAQHLARGLSTP